MPAGLFDIGIGHVIVAGVLPSGLLGCALFLVDVFCLGIKDAFYAEIGQMDLRRRLSENAGGEVFITVEPVRVR